MDAPTVARTDILDLSGVWRIRLDRDGIGEADQWFASELAGDVDFHLPGSVQEQGFGDAVTVDTPWTGLIIDRSYFTDDRYAPYREPGNIKIPFWLQPETHYRGAAWVQRDLDVPEDWGGRRIALTLERAHWETTVWIDERRVGSERSLTTAHRFDLGALAPGRHRLTIKIDNNMIIDVGPNAHSVSDHTQGNWNGIIGEITVAPVNPVVISGVELFPDVGAKSARVKINIAAGSARVSGTVRVAAERYNVAGDHRADPVSADFTLPDGGSGHVDLDLHLGDEAETWDEFHPALYAVTVDLTATADDQEFTDTRRTDFGLREVGVDGTQITINGRRTFIRGTLESCIFPLTGHPPTDVDAWQRIIGICRAHGLNQIRFHSWCPPEAAFVAADRAGFYLQVEGPFWSNSGAGLGEGRPVDAYVYEESWRLVEAYGNHPSFIMMAYGNEPGGRHEEFLSAYVTHWRKRDSRRLYTSGAGWPALAENDYDNVPYPRIQQWGAGLTSRINAQPPETITDYAADVNDCPRPLVSHEIGQWCVHPNFAEAEKYTGLMKPKNFEIFADFLAAAGMADQAEDFVHASGRLQVLCYKEEIESALRTPGFGGFQLLDLHDFPGQGTALVGVLDPFWDEKGYVTAGEFSRFCGPTVPLARLPKRVWRSDETLSAELQVAHFGATPLDAVISWQLLDDDGLPFAAAEMPVRRIAIGNEERHGKLRIPLSHIDQAQRVRLEVSVRADGVEAVNDWELWVYPRPRVVAEIDGALSGSGTIITNRVEEALRHVEQGRTVLLIARPEQVDSSVELGFSTVFWNTAWTRNQAPHTLGIVCDPHHPVLDGFPTDPHTNWQWWELIHGAAAMVLDDLPSEARGLVQPIDTWFSARRLGLLVEARVGSGRLMISSMDLSRDLDHRVVARQLRHSVLAYLGTDAQPAVELSADHVRGLFR